MSKTQKNLWKVIDRAVFGTNDPDSIKERFKKAYEKRQQKEKTLGGYLECLRRDDYLKTKEMALKAGVEQRVWQSWEADRTLPNVAELEQVCQNLRLGEHATKRVLELRSQLPQTILTRLSHYQPDQLVAHGAGVVENQMEWDKLHPTVQKLLCDWAQRQDIQFPEDFLQTLFNLETARAQKDWVIDVLGINDDE